MTLRAALLGLAVIAAGCPFQGRDGAGDAAASPPGGEAPDADALPSGDEASEQAGAGQEGSGAHAQDALGSPPATCPAALAPLPPGGALPAECIDQRSETTLAPAWERRPLPGLTLRFDGVVDADGALFWTETSLSDGSSELVSATRDGAIRFRVAACGGALALVGSTIVCAPVLTTGCSGPHCLVLEGRRTSDGDLAWRRDLLPVLRPWMRVAGSAPYGGLSGIAASGEILLVGASLLDSGTGEHESGYVALDPARGAVLWSERTSPEGNVKVCGAPLFAEDGDGYGSRTADYLRDEILVFAGGERPRPIGGGSPWHGGVVAAYGALLVSARTAFEATAGAAEVRCRTDGRILAEAGGASSTPILSGASAWFVAEGALARYHVATGELLWWVRPRGPPLPSSSPAGHRRPADCATDPLLTSEGSIIYADQRGVAGATSSEQTLGTPILHEIDAGGREVSRRRLPLEPECYTGPLALDGGRLFVGGQILPSAGARGVVRAFDLPGRVAAPRGWITSGGSMARERRAR